MAGVLDESGAIPLGELDLRGWGRRARLPLQGGRVLSRAALDAALVESASAAGAEIRMGTRALLGRWTGAGREVELRAPGGVAQRVHAHVVVAATGLHPIPLLPGSGEDSELEHVEGSRVGVGAVVAGWDDGPGSGVVRMTVGEAGYVGQVLQEDGRWVIAGALDRGWIQSRGGPGRAVEALLTGGGVSPDWTVEEGWRGTPALTRRRSRAAERGVYFLGDAAGYVEPFTGEGMGWALRGARELTDLVEQAVADPSPELEASWDRRYTVRVGRLQRLCRGIAWLGRRPTLARSAITVLSRVPGLARPALRRVAGLGLGDDLLPSSPHLASRQSV